MKNRWTAVLIAVTILFVGFLAGFFTGRATGQQPVTLSVRPAQDSSPTENTQGTTPTETAPPETTASKSTLPEPADTTAPGKVNVNTAGLDELMTLPGIGPVLGQAIVDDREENGPFSCLEELTRVKGIGSKRLEGILDYATVGGAE